MVSGFGSQSQRPKTLGMDRIKLRLMVLGLLIVATFVALFSRLWFLQVLASEDYARLAENNRIRRVESEPPRGLIRDRDGTILVRNVGTRAVALDRELLEHRSRKRRVLKRLSELLEVPVSEFRERLRDRTVSPYKPIAVADDATFRQVMIISENPEDFPGVSVVDIPVRSYPRGRFAPHLLGYVGEISAEMLESDHFKAVRPAYRPGDIVGREGIEYAYDRWLRGQPQVRNLVVNSAGKVIGDPDDPDNVVQAESPGWELYLSLDAGIQDAAEDALEAGITAARAAYEAPTGAVVVMDPNNGGVVALASYPDYDPRILADGFSAKESRKLGSATPNNADDDAMPNRAIQAQRPPGSTFKVVTAGAALSSGVADPTTVLDCPPALVYPPEGGPGSEIFHNWTSLAFGAIAFPESLEISCNTFYYQLGWRLETAYGARLGDKSERFQKYARTAGFGHDTGIELPNELDGTLPDLQWCEDNEDIGYCPLGWLPGYTVNMAIGQGDLTATPLQMATTYAAIANGGTVYEPSVALKMRKDEEGKHLVRAIEPKVAARLPLEPAELAVIQEGLERVVTGANGTARGAFSGFPLDRFPLAGKTGTAQQGDTGQNDSWFISYGPTTSPRYVIAVWVQEAGHGGETAGPIARQIWEAIFNIDDETNVRLGTDSSF